MDGWMDGTNMLSVATGITINGWGRGSACRGRHTVLYLDTRPAADEATYVQGLISDASPVDWLTQLVTIG
jgi:hypothetical protein